jgi:hypothetical protein
VHISSGVSSARSPVHAWGGAQRRATRVRRALRLLRLLGASVVSVVLLTVTGSGGALSAANAATGQPPEEYEVKAAFLFNFVRFVQWPAAMFESGSAPVVLGILGDDPFDGALDRAVEGHVVNGRAVRVRRVAGPADVAGCHVLFIPASRRRNAIKVLHALRAQSILTVGETEGFAAEGGVINFTREGNRVRFEINVGAATRARLTLSSQLLGLARIVQDAQDGSRR